MDLNSEDLRYPFFQIKKETSKTICLAKFHESTVWLYTGQLASCHHTPFVELGSTVDTFWNPEKRRDQQRRMLAEERPGECSYCWRLEDNNLLSDRYKKSMEYKNVDGPTDYKNPNYVFKPRTLELAFHNTCNLACSYCSPSFSTLWVNDIEQNGPYKNLPTDSRNHYTRGLDTHHKPADMQLFWEWFDRDCSTLESIRITGGEPLLHEETFSVFDRMVKINPNIDIVIHTNLCQKPTVIDRFISRAEAFKNIRLNISNESAGPVAEFIRDGMNYTEWLTNVERMSNTNVEASISTSITPTALLNLDQLYRDIIAIRNRSLKQFYIAVNFVSFPEFQSLAVLTQEEREFYHIYYSSFFESISNELLEIERSHVSRLLTMLKPELVHADQTKYRRDSEEFFKQYSLRRNKAVNYAQQIGTVLNNR